MHGPNHPNWNPNLTNEERYRSRHHKEYVYWRTSVYKRDNFICQKCNKPSNKASGELVAHHLYDWKNHTKQRYTINNGVTLCRTCHIFFHNKFMGHSSVSCTPQDFGNYLKTTVTDAPSPTVPVVAIAC